MLLARTTSPSSIDRAFAQLSQSLVPSGSWAWRTAPAVHAVWRGENLELGVDLPGVPRDAVSIDVAGRALTIAVEHRADAEQLRWSRSFQLGGSLDPDSVAARYADGRLVVTVAPMAKPASRKVAIAGPAATTPIEVVDTVEAGAPTEPAAGEPGEGAAG